MSNEYRNNSDPQICRQCQGLCCQGHPGVWINPERFLSSFNLSRPTTPEALKGLLPRELTLREIDGVAIPAPRETDDGCIFLEETGCLLPENRRPDQCLALKPVLETLIEGEIQCELPEEGSTLTAIINWRGFWENRNN